MKNGSVQVEGKKGIVQMAGEGRVVFPMVVGERISEESARSIAGVVVGAELPIQMTEVDGAGAHDHLSWNVFSMGHGVGG